MGKELFGKWKGNNETLDFRSNGEYYYNNVPLQYQYDGSTITVVTPRGNLMIPARVNGSELTVVINGQSFTYYRDGTEIDESEPVRSTGNDGREIAGKWCHQTSSSSNTGGSYHRQCLSLNPDGTFTFEAEGSMDARGYDQYGGQTFNGGVSSNDGSRGTWSFEGATIKLNGIAMSCQKTYYNSDPALNINGSLFVTYYRRAPW